MTKSSQKNMQTMVSHPGSQVSGTTKVPGDKSISHRSLMLGAIANGETVIRGFLAGEDCLATMSALRQLGVHIESQDAEYIRIQGVGLHGLRASDADLDMGNSGTGMRLMAGLLAGQAFKSTLTGDSSLQSRPMERVAEPLRRMGAQVETANGKAPLVVGGGALQPIEFTSPVASAQLKSAVLLAGLYASGTTAVTETGITRDHTERMLEQFGAQPQRRKQFASVTGPAELQGTTIDVPGDLSSAAFVLAAGLLAGNDHVQVDNVGINPTRTGVLDVLRLMGADIEVISNDTSAAEPIATLIARKSNLVGADVPPEYVPLAIDELPLIFALAACAEGETVITGADELRHKESDRIAIMAEGLRNLGVAIEEFEDGLRITGGPVSGGTINSHGDHRIAMAFSVIALVALGPITILDTANVATSFPDFGGVMRRIGLDVQEQAT